MMDQDDLEGFWVVRNSQKSTRQLQRDVRRYRQRLDRHAWAFSILLGSSLILIASGYFEACVAFVPLGFVIFLLDVQVRIKLYEVEHELNC